MMCLALDDEVTSLAELARRLCHTREDAEDLVQDTLERALRGSYIEQGTRRGWLATILRNRFRDQCRELRRQAVPISTIEHAPMPPSEELQPWQRVTEDQFAIALAKLDVEFRRVVELRAAGRSYAEIASELKISVNTVGTRLLRARAQLRETLRRNAK